MTLEEFMGDGEYLPPMMRDFHNCKTLFKIIGQMVERKREQWEKQSLIPPAELPHWVDAHIYTIDFFLWFMAKRGWTLQRSHRRVPFLDLQDDFRRFDMEEMTAFRQMAENTKRESPCQS